MNNKNKFPEDFYKFLAENTLTEIKGGTKRDKFLKIWIVNVDGRIFARTWSKSPRSWFPTLLEEGVGEIRYDDKVIKISAIRNNDPETNKLVDKAYLERYTQPENIKYAVGITQKEYWEYTVELLYSP